MGGDRHRQLADDVIHVVAGVLSDARGRILIARRTAGRDLAGAWEFPGGKVESGESALQALDRELGEELGIRVDAIEPLIAVPQIYPDKRILLDVHRVLEYHGTPRGLEKQALAWSPSAKLASYPMPPADIPVVAALNQPAEYLITPDPGDDDADSDDDFLAKVELALIAGIRRLQLRSRKLPPARLRALAVAMKQRCDHSGAQLLINGDIALARELGCGLHLQAAQLAAFDRRSFPAEQLLAASCHDAEELRRAQALGADFVVLGAVATTSSHPGQAALGWRGFAELREQVSLPIYALGGLGRGDLPAARQHGAQGIAAIRGFWPADSA